MVKLFHASSVIERLTLDNIHFNAGIIHWYKVNSSLGKHDYSRLIDSYSRLNREQKIYSEELVNELLTEEEIDQLRRYLITTRDDTFVCKETDGNPLKVRRASFPITHAEMGYRLMPVGGTAMRVSLSERKDYNLPFVIEGYFDLSEESFQQRIDDSIAYIRKALQMLGVDAGIKIDQVEDVVDELYKRDGLYVTTASPGNVFDHVEWGQ